MNVIKQIKVWYNKVVASAKQKKAADKAKELEEESRQVLQAMEFEGGLFLCFKGFPIIREDQLNTKIPDALNKSRDTYMNYVTSKEV
ncbi:MAG: hypothetical protein LKE54_08300 [Prevotella sp.]|jgi:hypothetical protein|nr:hypothetical protein [Prevotella sp.]MCH3995032.1 hypothetical protein [Prevotella sp.]